MKKARDMNRIQPPTPVAPPVCAACKSFRPEVLVPHGSGSLQMCWLCAHHMVDHGSSMREAVEARCSCHPTEIYPRGYYDLAQTIALRERLGR